MRFRFVVLVAVLASVVSACSGAADPGASRTATDTVSGPDTTPSSSVPEVLDFQAPLLDGGTFDGKTVAGKDVAFWFWAPW